MSGRTLTTNRNLLSPTKFRLVINSLKYENVEFFCTSAPLPGMNLPDTPMGVRGATAYIPGDKIQYDPMTFKILIDEDLKNYSEIYNWIHQNHSSGQISYEDMTLQIFNSANRKNKEILFKSCFPTTISTGEFSTQNTDVEYMTMDVTFRFDRFTLV